MSLAISRRAFVAMAAGAAVATASAAPESPAAPKTFDDFYAMDTGLRGPDVPRLEDKVKLLAELGYWGIDYTLNHAELPRLIDLLDGAGVRLACVYSSPVLGEKPDAALGESVKRLKGRLTRIELAIQSTKYKPSDPAGDAVAADVIRRVSDLAADTGPVVSVYPHTGSWAERVQDGVRLARLVGRKNVGTNFNLVHWAWVKQDQPLGRVLAETAPHLKAVSVNGLAGRKIVPLGAGDYDVAAFVRELVGTGYDGPVGFQGYGIPGPSRELLGRSIRKWREIERAL